MKMIRKAKKRRSRISDENPAYAELGAMDPEDSGSGLRLRKELMRFACELAALALFLLIVFRFFFGITVQHGNDMYPALRDGDIIIYSRTTELVNTEACVYRAEGRLRTGRIAATEGTVISATGDMQLTFDGVYLPALPGSGIYDRTYAAEEQMLPFTVSEDAYFILGDYRTNAEDSRVLGQIDARNIQGRIIAVFRRRQI